MGKIALITEKYTPEIGGLGISVERIARLLTGAGRHVFVFTLSSVLKPGRVESADEQGVSVHRLGPHRRVDDTLADWFETIVAHCQDTRRQAEPFDLLHGYYLPRAGFTAVYAGGYLGLPSVVSARGNDLDRAVHDPRKAAHILYALGNASAITANTRQLARKAATLATGREVTRIPNGVDTELFKPGGVPRSHALVEMFGLTGRQVLGFSGEARAKKGLPTMLLATKALASRRPVCLMLLGGVRAGDDAHLLDVFIKQNPDVYVLQIPHVPLAETPTYYALMDVLLMLSRRDGLPNAVLEAMACGLPVVASPVGGIPDLIQDGENGLLVPPDDPPALAAAVERILDDEGPLRERLTSSARATVLAHFTPQAELQATLDLYASLPPLKQGL